MLARELRTLSKYWSLYRGFFRASIIADLEFRMNFVVRILTDIFWYLAQIVTFEVLYQHTEKIGDWNVYQTRVFLGLLFVIDAIYMIVFSDGLDQLTEKVRKGDLDLLLTKPVNSQFIVSCQRANTAIFGNLLMALAWLGWSLGRLPDFSWSRLSWLFIMVPAGLTVYYTMRFFFSSFAVILARSENLQFLWWQIYRLGTRPDSIYFPWLKYVLLTALPVGMIASVPARVIMEPGQTHLILWGLFLIPSLIYFSNRFWKFCLKFYTSASS
jgi:ABC-2 type transport system permease protein